MKGQVYKTHSNSYLVKCDEKTYTCKARGVLKIRKSAISVGDFVEFEGGVINAVLERKNHFIRPNVSNVDVIVAVVSPEPKPDFLLVDKLLLSAVKEDVETVIVVNKTDVDNSLKELVEKEYLGTGVDIIEISAKNGDGVERLKEKLIGKLSVLAGQSAAGKTSIINAMFGLNLKTGELSEKILRGRHTTTASEIFQVGEYKIVDSPGFAVIEAAVNLEQLPDCYPEYFEVALDCKFRGCKHISEPDCKVKELVENGVLSKARYLRYVEIYNEILKRREIYEKD